MIANAMELAEAPTISALLLLLVGTVEEGDDEANYQRKQHDRKLH